MASSTADLPDPKDLSYLFSRTTQARAASSIKKFYKYFAIPGIGQLAGGLPNDLYFPYDTLEARVALPDRWPPSKADGKAVDRSSDKHPSSPPDSHLLVPHAGGTTDVARKIDLMSALQYGTAQGYPPLYDFIKRFATQHMHPNIPYAGNADVILTCGSTDGFSKALQCFNNEWSEGRDPVEEREGLLCEQFAYMNAIQAARPRGMNIAPVAIDDEGMMADGEGGLEDVLENWDFKKGKRPHMMYTVTVGQNPTSGVLSIKRRQAIYALCQKYDVIIVEDDPYWYLQFPSSLKSTSTTSPTPIKSSSFAFLDSLIPSYLSIDVDGRVVRLDTFSKTVAPGCRLGWITAQPAMIERLLRITETSTQQPSGFVQSMVAELLIGPTKGGQGSGGAKDGSGWDLQGWVRWLEGLRGEYERRMTTMSDILDKGKIKIKNGRRKSLTKLMGELSTSDDDLEDWSVIQTMSMYDFPRPQGGMFLWITMAFHTHPLAGSVLGPRLAQALWVLWTTEPYRVLVSPGTMFSPSDEIREEHGWKCFRLCFAAAPKAELANISRRFVQGVHAFWDIKDVAVIDDLLKDIDEAHVKDTTGMAVMTGFC